MKTDKKSMVGRLAPSPTGALHLGNARTFLIAWLRCRSQCGRLLLRMEDLDHFAGEQRKDAEQRECAEEAWREDAGQRIEPAQLGTGE